MGSVAQFTIHLIILQTAVGWRIRYSSTFMIAPKWRAPLLAALAIGAMFAAFAGDGIGAYFTPDDMMNLNMSWSAAPLVLLRGDRPLGALAYRAMFALFGLHPLPYRVLCFALLVMNLVLLYGFCRRVSGSREVAALACLIGAYHAHLADLYYSTGTIYDLLCCLFFLLAFNLYLDKRSTPAVLAMYVCALASKEMAVLLPVYVAIREGRRALQSRFLWFAAPVTAAYAAWKLAGPMTANPAYAVHFTLHAFLTGWKSYLQDLFYGSIEFNTAKLIALWIVLAGFAVWIGKREGWLAWWIVMVGMLPFLFIAPRGFFVMYLVLPGWYLLAASFLLRVREWLVAWAPALEVRPEQAALFLGVALLLIPQHRAEKPVGKAWVAASHQQVRTILETLQAKIPTMPHGAKVLFLNDPYDADDWILTSTFRLQYRDHDLSVDRVKVDPTLAAKADEYAHVFTLDEKGMGVVR